MKIGKMYKVLSAAQKAIDRCLRPWVVVKSVYSGHYFCYPTDHGVVQNDTVYETVYRNAAAQEVTTNA